jgi:hypothetical protein
MDTGLIIISTSAICGIIYILLGVLLAYKQKIEIINGVDFSKINDKEGFCKLVGNSFLSSGVIIFILGVAVYYLFLNLLLVLVLFIFFSSLPIYYFLKARERFTSGAS